MIQKIDDAITRLAEAVRVDDPDKAATMTLAVLNLTKARETLVQSQRDPA